MREGLGIESGAGVVVEGLNCKLKGVVFTTCSPQHVLISFILFIRKSHPGTKPRRQSGSHASRMLSMSSNSTHQRTQDQKEG